MNHLKSGNRYSIFNKIFSINRAKQYFFAIFKIYFWWLFMMTVSSRYFLLRQMPMVFSEIRTLFKTLVICLFTQSSANFTLSNSNRTLLHWSIALLVYSRINDWSHCLSFVLKNNVFPKYSKNFSEKKKGQWLCDNLQLMGYKTLLWS